ncbi:hypothetical protein [Arenibacter latericius]|uniref:hypothetical protein n=1 Tax=Arenibacter latericius TaxID=86104 RepID=UPI00047BB9C2|nr:hypothetical protein [Arenibacter latericius]MDX1362691.1 hypothetical protein [Arenibacter latericius]
MKYNLPFLVLFLVLCSLSYSQTKQEREHRIKKSQFPIISTNPIPEAAKRIRYYREVDSTNTLFKVKFALKRMKYEIDVDQFGEIEQLGLVVKEIDIPKDTYSEISNYMERNFLKVKVKRILQWYPANSDDAIRSTFQNLILPTNTYEVLVRGKKNITPKIRQDYKLLFNSNGVLLQVREALPINFDRILY